MGLLIVPPTEGYCETSRVLVPGLTNTQEVAVVGCRCIFCSRAVTAGPLLMSGSTSLAPVCLVLHPPGPFSSRLLCSLSPISTTSVLAETVVLSKVLQQLLPTPYPMAQSVVALAGSFPCLKASAAFSCGQFLPAFPHIGTIDLGALWFLVGGAVLCIRMSSSIPGLSAH